MGKLIDNLTAQLGNPDTREDALQCIDIYNTLKSISNGKVWESDWRTLVNVRWVEDERIYRPTEIGRIFLKGIESK